MLIKGTIHQEELTILNICAPNIVYPDTLKKTLMDLIAQIRH
jgi:hypothetical protein